MSGGSFWDMLNSHTKVAGIPVHSEDEIQSPLIVKSELRNERERAASPAKSTWSSEEKKLFRTAVFLTTCGKFDQRYRCIHD